MHDREADLPLGMPEAAAPQLAELVVDGAECGDRTSYEPLHPADAHAGQATSLTYTLSRRSLRRRRLRARPLDF